MIKHGSKMIQAVTNATVPQITIYCGASFGAGNYGMCGRGFHPRFCFSWPNAKTAVMGGEQAAKTMVIVTEAAMKRKGEVDQAKLDAMEQRIVEHFDSQMSVFTTSARLLDDGVIDPRDTRAVLAQGAVDLPRCRSCASRRRCSSRWRAPERHGMQLTPEHEALRDTLKRFIDTEVNPHVDEWERAEIFPAHQVFEPPGRAGPAGPDQAGRERRLGPGLFLRRGAGRGAWRA